MSNNNKVTIAKVKAALSSARVGTYEVAAKVTNDSDLSALNLYAWNAAVSGAFLSPLHICEVVVRNAVSDALEGVYGVSWPWNATFLRSLPNPPHGYSPRADLINARRSVTSTGKVIPELKFAFWQRMFTVRHETRVWTPHLLRVLPNLDATKSVATHTQEIYDDLELVRRLRNRIAHHEPIFKRALAVEYQVILKLVQNRCLTTAIWMDSNQNATQIIAAKP